MGKGLKVHLFIVDPQNDFMGNDDGTPYSQTFTEGTTIHTESASLPVKGAVSDMKRAAKLVDRAGKRLDDIHVTLDSHRVIDVAHQFFWSDQNGRPPAPMVTMIFERDIQSEIWLPRNLNLKKRMIDYTHTLEQVPIELGYRLLIWNEHCRVGTWGHNVHKDLMEALMRWERNEYANVNFVTKGSNPYTEHYGGLMAEVPDPNDPSTQLNTKLIQILQEADIVGFLGEASSHCVRATVQQVANNIGEEHLKKFHLITDCMSPVPMIPGVTPDFPAIAEAFLKDMQVRGMTLTTSDKFLA